MMTNNLKTQKESLRAEAIKARSLLSMSADEHTSLCNHFFDNIEIDKNAVVAAYWAKGRELNAQYLINACLRRAIKVALPVIQNDSLILKFAAYDDDTDMITGAFGIAHPAIDAKTQWVEPHIFLIPLLAFDRKGHRLGFGGGYFDATLDYYKNKKDITAIGIAYAQQACLFNLPAEEHDIEMDFVITQHAAHDFRKVDI